MTLRRLRAFAARTEEAIGDGAAPSGRAEGGGALEVSVSGKRLAALRALRAGYLVASDGRHGQNVAVLAGPELHGHHGLL